MTVRWKPLLILSGLFLVIAMMGLMVMAVALGPRGTGDFVRSARSDRAAKKYDRAKIHYQNALQAEPRNAAIHEELAAMYAEWAEGLSGEKAEQLRAWRFASLEEAAKHGKGLVGPRKALLAEALRLDEGALVVRWSRELLPLEPANADAHYALASELLEDVPPDLPAVRKHLEAIDAPATPKARLAYVKARLAKASEDEGGLESALAPARALALPADADPVDRLALLRLRALDVRPDLESDLLAERVRAFQAEAKAMADDPGLSPARINRLAQVLEQVQKALTLAAAVQTDPAARTAITALGTEIEAIADATYARSIESGTADLRLYLTYAEHLRFRQKRARCLEVVDTALKSPLAQKGGGGELVMGLHAVAVEAALGDVSDAARFDVAAPHIQELLGCSYPAYQGLGHLFQGAIELEKSGVAAAPADATASAPAAPAVSPAKLRASALGHLKSASELLPHVAEAQARYGVALILSQEQGLGRQYMAKALRMGELDPQYQIWAAWSMVQAGYPEEAEPIVEKLLAEVEAGRRPAELGGSLQLLRAEVYQARRTPDDLKKAVAAYEKAFAAGQEATPTVQLRLAQIDVMLNRSQEALARIDRLKAEGKGTAAAEHLAVLTLREQAQVDEARARLEAARKDFPRSGELAGLDAALRIRDGKPEEAEAVLAGFLEDDPENVALVQMRAQVLAEHLKKPAEARQALLDIADRAENSAPMVQLALLDLERRDFEAAAETIAKVRRRWKEAAAADLLDAQMAIARGQLDAAAGHFAEALKKDPTNKVVQFWKAQVDGRTGQVGEAARALEALAREKPTKELDAGLSLMTAAESALASLELAGGNLDSAIARFNQLLKGGAGETARTLRWQLVSALSAKGRWDEARREIQNVLDDATSPPDADDRVRAAEFFRVQKDLDAAAKQLDLVLTQDPTHAAAVVARASLLHDAGKSPEAAALLRKAIGSAKAPVAAHYLMLAALENLLPPADAGLGRALVVLDEGLKALPGSVELVQAKYKALRIRGDDDAALAFIKEKAEDDPKGTFRRLLVEIYRDKGDLASAEATLRALREAEPEDPRLAASLVRLVAEQAIRAATAGDEAKERELNDRTALLIREFRGKFPQDLAFPQAECELAARKGELARAAAITKEIDEISKSSPVGPLLRARLFSAQGRTLEVARAYDEALGRNPRQLDVRILLGQTRLELGDVDEALKQASYVLDVERDRPEALLLKARALANAPGAESQVAQNRQQAANLLTRAIQSGRMKGRLDGFYHLLAEVYALQGKRADAVKTLMVGINTVPGDASGLSLLIELLCTPAAGASAPAEADLEAARAYAKKYADDDKTGYLCLAAAIGFHKGRQFASALPWAERASALLDVPAVHLNFGDLLLSMAEATTGGPKGEEALGYFRRAVEEYDKVLAADATSVEAINNKAWILHSYLDRSRDALALATGLLRRVDPTTLPGEFFDTLGSIQEALGQVKDAEESYARGLRKSPQHPMLNYHMGRLLASNPDRASNAASYLEKAKLGSDQLPPPMAAEVTELLARAGR